MKKTIASITLAGIWITFFEFLRNEILLKNYWINHFSSIGLDFKTTPLNGVLWTVWSFLLAYLIFSFLEKYSFQKTIWLSWISAFLMMWITIYNLQVLPIILLLFAVPFSLIEVVIAILIIKRFGN